MEMDGTELGKFLESQSVNWLRGLSRGQISACDRLFRALRDDTEQESTYRVSRCMNYLGLRPMVSSSRIKTIMKISHGSELAFLYFLWEAEYKPIKNSTDTEGAHTNFTVNEQLLLSAIAHLDMPATLRELDRLLPPPTHSKKLRRGGCTKLRHESVTQPKPKRGDNVTPYFAPLPRPKLFKPTEKKQWGPPESKLRFPEYAKYRGLYEIPEENSRWFSHYQLSPGKRVIKKLLSDELNRLILDPTIMGVEEGESLCHTHRLIKKAAEKKQEEMTHAVFQRYLSLLDVSGSILKASRKRVIQNLERDIECAADKIRHFSRRKLIEVRKIRSGKVDGTCQLCTHLVSTPHMKRADRADLSILLGSDLNPIAHPLPQDDGLVKVIELQGQHPKGQCGAGDCKLVEVGDILIKPSEEGNQPHKRKTRKKSSLIKIKRRGRSTQKGSKVLTTDFKILTDLIPPCSRTLQCPRQDPVYQEPDCFTTRTDHGIEFDYFKIFMIPGLLDVQDVQPQSEDFPVDLEDKQPLIEKLCIAALTRSNGASPRPHIENEWSSKAVLKAAASCAMGVFRENASLKETSMAAEEKGEQESRTAQKVKLINPDDRQQIESLLKSALKVMKLNPNYVLATFPNAHKLPMLIDWVSNRYGKVYTRKEMQAFVNTSRQLIERIGQREMARQKKMLNVKTRPDSGLVSYAHKKALICQAKQLKREYYGQLNQLALEETRLTWLALRGDSHLGGYIGDTFFAYMPANEADLKRHNLWQSRDYRDMVENRLISERRRLV
ncbi:uncharacterized protein LOC111074151 [Drosophila obscura]|uniref:uncharacterized protein LOC111074151 n=1 Tax=Drosophila obscura TaxID=7282 RepID=UPI001BB16D46|nr:uncharacterized protein LOC111074151 [Drosophila obscura]